jgi:TM2 domain-containing membrane protein YozV
MKICKGFIFLNFAILICPLFLFLIDKSARKNAHACLTPP